MTGPIIILIIVALVVFILVRNSRIVPQAQAYVVTRLGAYKETWHTGLHLKIPFFEGIEKRVSLKEQVADFPPQPVITKDNVTMQIDTVVYSRSPIRSSIPTASSARFSPSKTSAPRRCVT